MAKKRRAKRKVRRISTRKKSFKRVSRRKKSGMFGGFFPISGEDALIDFVTGALTEPVSNAVKPLQDKLLPSMGQYTDEASLAIVGSLVHKFGGKVSPKVKKIGKEMFRVAVISTGQAVGTGMAQNLFSRVGLGNNATSGNSSTGAYPV